jgi:hypothetical protein
MLKKAFGDNVMSQSKTFLWYKRFKGDERLSTTLSVLDDRQQAQHRKTS